MDQKKELTQEEMKTVYGGITLSSTPYQICPRCRKPFPTKEFLRHLAVCRDKK